MSSGCVAPTDTSFFPLLHAFVTIFHPLALEPSCPALPTARDHHMTTSLTPVPPWDGNEKNKTGDNSRFQTWLVMKD